MRFGRTGQEAKPVDVSFRHTEGHGSAKHTQRVDLVLRFDIEDTGIKCGHRQASLTGRTVSGEMFGGSGAIRTVGCGPSGKVR